MPSSAAVAPAEAPLEEPAQAEPTAYKRAGDFTDGIGSSVNAILDRDVLLLSYTTGMRRVFDQRQDATIERPYCEVTVQELNSKGEPTGHPRLFHAWSAALAERLSAVPTSSLPVIARFSSVKTANGFAAYIVE